MTAIQCSDLRFGYRAGSTVLAIDALSIEQGERVFLKGASGSGKSTLLGLISGILVPSSGRISVLDETLSDMSAARRDRFRASHLGVIFQMFNLLPYLPAGQNILLAGQFSGSRKTTAKQARDLMDRLGLDPKLHWNARPSELSVGQQQRVAAARALIGGPRLILADEPTSALDTDTRDQFIGLLKEECERNQATLLFVSHDASLSHHFDRALDLVELNGALS